MECPTCFDVRRYAGRWYELAHYPTWFELNDNYNTMAEYIIDDCPDRMTPDGPLIHVINSTVNQGIYHESRGTAKYLRHMSFRVDFPIPEQVKIAMANQTQPKYENSDEPNYVIDRIWTNCAGEYIFAVVTNLNHDSLYVLSRYPRPSLIAYNEIMTYISQKFDPNRIVQTPHYC